MWTNDEICSLKRAHHVHATSSSCWQHVARDVGRSAEECCTKWFADVSYESMTSREAKSQRTRAEKRAAAAVTAVKDAAEAVATEDADLRKVKTQLKRALNGLKENAAPPPLKKPRDAVLVAGGDFAGVDKALESVANVPSPPEEPRDPPKQPHHDEWRPGRAYLASLSAKAPVPRRAPAPVPRAKLTVKDTAGACTLDRGGLKIHVYEDSSSDDDDDPLVLSSRRDS